ncbi:MAG: YggS family pyridoxal phosphate-dependent enzyme [Armatimonadetes bacterium]|nr:YggS family pyridoxal phosphate-dependent enzyme [Armatimonadota bacterium]
MSLETRLQGVRDRLSRACDAAGRDPASVTLIAVSKTFPLDLLKEAYDLGVRDFGESRWQEAKPKIEAMPDDVTWHFIGHLQSNKAKAIGTAFDWVHTVSTESALKELSKVPGGVDAFIEVNSGEESQKSGIFPNFLDDFAKIALQYPLVRLLGLMHIGPALEPEAARKFHRLVNERRKSLGLQFLSAGMSHDMEVAIQEGSTHIRIGSAIFGER